MRAVQPPGIMSTSFVRAALSLPALVGLLAACASRSPDGERPPQPVTTTQQVEGSPGDPIEKLIQRVDPGVLVSRTPDGGIAVQIRGNASFYGAAQPLYVVDDVPIAAGPGGALAGINPHDIDSIRVLKNPADIGIYGMRGANGVIVIKMKKPGQR
jgi:TonB-dependent SusC/RagA subfamily outer membrane receptor